MSSFPGKEERRVCWDSRDRYWECLDMYPSDNKQCAKLRQLFEQQCPSQWVSFLNTFFIYLILDIYFTAKFYCRLLFICVDQVFIVKIGTIQFLCFYKLLAFL